jgi:hypothetical protein
MTTGRLTNLTTGRSTSDNWSFDQYDYWSFDYWSFDQYDHRSLIHSYSIWSNSDGTPPLALAAPDASGSDTLPAPAARFAAGETDAAGVSSPGRSCGGGGGGSSAGVSGVGPPSPPVPLPPSLGDLSRAVGGGLIRFVQACVKRIRSRACEFMAANAH